MRLFVDPPSWHFENDRLFDRGTAPHAGDDILAPFIFLRDRLAERGVKVHTADLMGPQNGAAPQVFVSLGGRDRFRRVGHRADVVLSGFFAFECPIVEPRLYRDLHRIGAVFRRVFTYSTADALRPFLQGPVHFERFRIPQAFDDAHSEIWSRRDRGFLVMINANKRPRLTLNELYSERLRAVEFFGRFDEIDLYGVGWDGPTMHLGETWVPSAARRAGLRVRVWSDRAFGTRDTLLAAARRRYRGPTSSKAETLGAYTFSICFENMVLEGWITEKIFDCFFAGTVPVYLGAPDVGEWIPKDCFIDMRDFGGYEELHEFLCALGPKDVEIYREAARDFLRSEKFAPFSKQAFADLVWSLVAADAAIES